MSYPDVAPPYAIGAAYVLSQPLAKLIALKNYKDFVLPTVHLEDVSVGLWISHLTGDAYRKGNAGLGLEEDGAVNVHFVDEPTFKVLKGCRDDKTVINPVDLSSSRGSCMWGSQRAGEERHRESSASPVSPLEDEGFFSCCRRVRPGAPQGRGGSGGGSEGGGGGGGGGWGEGWGGYIGSRHVSAGGDGASSRIETYALSSFA